ncbi:MAG: glycosyltransferase family 4 protein [Planctomycetes bacterium]|nr:glycosyltransferase family 4 protein [Planctomycetota bacterium]
MRIAYVCCDPGVPVFGCKGCSIHVQEVLREFVRRGFQVDLFAVRVGGEPPEELSGVRLHTIEVPKANNAAQRGRLMIAANADVKEMLSSNGPFDLVYERYALHAYAAMEYARNLQIPGILEVNSPLIAEQARYRTLTDFDLAEQTTRRAMISAGAIVAVSPRVADYAWQQRLSSTDIHVLPNGVDTQRFRGADESTFPRKQGEFTVGFVGTLKPWHGVENLIEAFGLLAVDGIAMRLAIVGNGPERERLEYQASCLPHEAPHRVHFLGAVNPSEIPSLLASMDVAVAPYLPQEDFYFSPLKIFEYMAAGLPTVASRLGQIPELLQDDETGLLYPPGDTHALTDALQALCQHPSLCSRLGQAARKTAVRRFTWESVVTQILEISGSLRRKQPAIPKPHLHFHESQQVKNPTY